MEIDLLGGTYQHKFKDWNSQRTINWYPKITDQKAQEKNKTKIGLFPRPGLTQFSDVGGDSIRGLFVARTLKHNRCFAVSGTSLYEILYDGSNVLRGALTGMSSGSKSKVYMAANSNNQLMIQDPLAGYIFDMDSNTLTKITDIDYPNGTTLDFSDAYFIISDGEGRVSFSDLLDGLTWPGINFFTPTFKPDKVKAIVASREEIYCFGAETLEIYIDDGATPFVRQSRTSMYYGLRARDSIAVHPAGVFYLGTSAMGGAEVYLMGLDYSITPIASPDVSDIINQATNEDAEGFVVNTKDGHIFYHLHLPALKTTMVYDLTTGMWHERQSLRPAPDADGEKIWDIYRGRNHVNFKGINLFGDWHSGKIFKEDDKVSTDDGNVRRLKRISPVFFNELKYISVYSLQLDVNSGVGTVDVPNPTMMLRYSLDGGNTFESEEHLSLGAQGSYDERVIINNLGTARNWVIDFEVSDPVDVIVMQAQVHGSFGTF